MTCAVKWFGPNAAKPIDANAGKRKGVPYHEWLGACIVGVVIALSACADPFVVTPPPEPPFKGGPENTARRGCNGALGRRWAWHG